MTPSVSIVMSVYNAESYLEDAIKSILGQTYRDFEFIIIDDGSTDNSTEIVRSFKDSRIRLVQQENCGLQASLNRGIGLSAGEYIARMDADDISEPSRLAHQVQYMDSNPNCVLVGTGAFLIDMDGQLLHKLEMPCRRDIIWQELERCVSPFVHGAVMFRKVAALRCGLYDERMVNSEDWMLWTKMFNIGEMTNLPDLLYRRRLTPEAITNMPKHMTQLKASILHRVLTTGVLTDEDAQRLYFLGKNVSPRERMAQYQLRAGKVLLEGDWQPERARRYIWRSIRILPWNPTSWINLVFCFLPYNWVSAWKRYRTKK